MAIQLLKVLISLSLVIVLTEGISFAANPDYSDTNGLQHFAGSGKLPPKVEKQIQETDEAEIIVALDVSDIRADAGRLRQARRLKIDSREIIAEKSGLYRKRKDVVLKALAPFKHLLIQDYSALPVLHLKVGRAAIEKLMGMKDVLSVNENRALPPLLLESLQLIQAPVGGDTGNGTAVAVLDTGVDYTRDAFGNCTAPGVPSGTCKVAFAQDFAPDDNSLDDDGHGTNISGVVVGVAPDTDILGLDVFRTDGYAYDSYILTAIDWVLTNRDNYNIRSVNMSFGGGRYNSPCPSDNLAQAIADLKTAGITTVVASGNNAYTNAISSPACAPDAVSVGAVYDADLGGINWGICTDSATAADQVACFSNSAPFLTLLAPGSEITAAGYTMSGTSMAAPHVAGAAAVMKGKYGSLTVDEVVSRLKFSGTPLRDGKSGVMKPRIDLLAAVNLAEPYLEYSPAAFYVKAPEGNNPGGGTLGISFRGTGPFGWSAADDAAWLSLSPESGTDAGIVTVSVNVSGLAVGTHSATITITADGGTTNSPVTVPVTLEITDPAYAEDFEAGDLSGLPWVTGGHGSWTVQGVTKHSGAYAVKTPSLADSQSSYLQVTLNVTSPGYLRFWTKTSTEPRWDKLKLYIDGSSTAGKWDGWHGENDWFEERSEYSVTTGIHTFKWIYSKDGSVSQGSDAVWLDDIFFPPSNLVPVSPVSKDFGNVAVGRASALQTFSVSNIGGTDTTLGTLSLSGTDQADFVIENDLCSGRTLGASGSCTVGVKFMPASEGSKSADLNIPSDYVITTVSALSGTGVLLPDAAIVPVSHDFGPVAAGSSSSAQTFTVSNNGTGDLVIGTVTLSGTDVSDFLIQNDTCSGQTLIPSGSCTVQAKFSPLTAGSKTANLSFPSNDPDTPTLNATLSGTGIPLYTLTVNKDGSTGFGTVTSVPSGIDCGTDCTELYEQDTVVTLSAEAEANSTFSGWSGSGCSGTGTCDVAMTGDQTVTAVFAILPPVADFIGLILSGDAPLAVIFDDLSTNDPTTWSWDFGDSGTSSEQNPLHTFRTAGTYSVTLTSSNTSGSDFETKIDYITVSPCGSQPVRISGVDRGTSIQNAYDNDANDGDVINTQAVEFIESLTLGRPISITLAGGYNCGYTSNPSDTVINASLTISDGTVIIENISIQ